MNNILQNCAVTSPAANVDSMGSAPQNVTPVDIEKEKAAIGKFDLEEGIQNVMAVHTGDIS